MSIIVAALGFFKLPEWWGGDKNALHFLTYVAFALTFFSFVREYFDQLYSVCHRIYLERQAGDFGIESRDAIYSYMASSFTKSAEADNEICVTSFLIGDPTKKTAAMRKYHVAAERLIHKGAHVNRAITIQDIEKLEWLEKQRYQFASQNGKGRRFSLRVLDSDDIKTGRAPMPLNMNLYNKRDVYIINPAMIGGETPIDKCSYFTDNEANYSIYRGLFQSIWDSSIRVIENGVLNEANYTLVCQRVIKEHIFQSMRGPWANGSKEEMKDTLRRFSVDLKHVKMFRSGAEVAPFLSYESAYIEDRHSGLGMQFIWWNTEKSDDKIKADRHGMYRVLSGCGRLELQPTSADHARVSQISSGRIFEVPSGGEFLVKGTEDITLIAILAGVQIENN